MKKNHDSNLDDNSTIEYKTMKVSEFSKKFNIKRDQVYRMMKDSSLPKIKIGNRKYRVLVKAEWLNNTDSENETFITLKQASTESGIEKELIKKGFESKNIRGIKINRTIRLSVCSINGLKEQLKEAFKENREGKFGTIEL